MARKIDMEAEKAYEMMFKQETEAYKQAENDEERRIHEARLKDLIKSYNEYKTTPSAEVNAGVEVLKIKETGEEKKKDRRNGIIVTTIGGGLGLLATLLGIRATRKNMEVLSEYEREHYVATTAEKKAVEQSIDVGGMVRRIESNFKK